MDIHWYRLRTLGWFGNNIQNGNGINCLWNEFRHRCGAWTDDDNFKKSANSPFFIYIPTLTGGISIEINIGGPKILNGPNK